MVLALPQKSSRLYQSVHRLPSRGWLLSLLLAAFALAGAGSARAQWDLFVGGQAGAQIFWNTNLIRVYNFGVTTPGGQESVILSNVLVSAKRSGGTTGNWSIALYNGFGGTGQLLTTAGATNSVFGTTDFSTYTLGLTNPQTLTPGAYSIVLISEASGSGNNQMYLKESKLLLTSSTNSTSVVAPIYWVEDNNTTGTAGTNISANFVLADFGTRTNVNFGNYRLGATLSTNAVLTNTAFFTSNNVTEQLSAVATASNVATVSGLGTNLMARAITTNYTVGMTTANAGTNTGTINLAFNSLTNGTASPRTGGPTNVGAQVITVTGVGYRLADDAVSTTNLNLGRFHIGYNTNMGSLSGAVGITNTATGDGFSEGLAVANNGSAGGATVGGIPGSLIAAGANANITLGLGSVSTVGTNSGSVTLGFQSSGTGTSGFAATNIGTQVVNVVAQGYSGQAIWNADGGGSWNNFDNWDVPGGTPGIDGVLLSTNDQATFGGAISSARTVSLNGQSPVLTLLSFSNASASYTVAQGSGGSISMGTDSHQTPVINNAAGNHTVSAGITLAYATQADVATNSKLTIGGALNGTQNLQKTGVGTLSITGTGNLSGNTTVTAGTLQVNGSIASSDVTVQDGALLTGVGTIGDMVLQSGGTVNPGNSPGTIYATNVVWNGGANYNWQIFDAATNNAPGSTWDFISASGTLDLQFLSDTNRFNINLWSLSGVSPDVNGLANNFINTQSYRWTILTAAGGITGGFDTNKFNVNLAAINGTSGWANDLGGGSIFVDVQGNNLDLVFNPNSGPQPVPEPGTWAAAALLLGAAGYVRWRRRKVS